MDLNELSLEISRSFIEKKYPDQISFLNEYLKNYSPNFGYRQPDEVSHRFGPPEAIGNLLVPVILGVVSNLIYELLKSRFTLRKNPIKFEINFEKLNRSIQNKMKVSQIEMSIIKQIEGEVPVREIISYCINYIEIHYG